jgi:nucleoside-diphosphate-sugar epimerase
MNILLTGYAGFLGYHLSKKLIDLGRSLLIGTKMSGKF